MVYCNHSIDLTCECIICDDFRDAFASIVEGTDIEFEGRTRFLRSYVQIRCDTCLGRMNGFSTCFFLYFHYITGGDGERSK